mmetsp:Transcript_41663/g.89453  ORF Transcript_41663/g.89453 Transcript_41663/m.89453 type:complete len:113 (+) Transcript_41663:187-525(+)
MHKWSHFETGVPQHSKEGTLLACLTTIPTIFANHARFRTYPAAWMLAARRKIDGCTRDLACTKTEIATGKFSMRLAAKESTRAMLVAFWAWTFDVRLNMLLNLKKMFENSAK